MNSSRESEVVVWGADMAERLLNQLPGRGFVGEDDGCVWAMLIRRGFAGREVSVGVYGIISSSSSFSGDEGRIPSRIGADSPLNRSPKSLLPRSGDLVVLPEAGFVNVFNAGRAGTNCANDLVRECKTAFDRVSAPELACAFASVESNREPSAGRVDVCAAGGDAKEISS